MRDWSSPAHIKDLIASVNRARRENPALQQLANLRFLEIDSDQLIAYVKWTPDGANQVIVVVNLDPFAAHAATVSLRPDAMRAPPGASYQVCDLLTGERYTWGERNYVHLDPVAGEPAHILRVEPQ